MTERTRGDAIAEVADLILRAASIYITEVEARPPQTTLDNRFLAEAEACYFAACKAIDRKAYVDMTEGWE